MNKLPNLKIVHVTKLKLHETVDPVRVTRLLNVIKAAKSFTNPLIVSPLTKDSYVVLDGANRTTVFRKLRYKYIIVQVVLRKDVELQTWNHYVENISYNELINFLKNNKINYSLQFDSGSNKYPEVLLKIYTNSACLVIYKTGTYAKDITCLTRIVEWYKHKYRFHRILSDNYKESNKNFHKSGALFVYSMFLSRNIDTSAKTGIYLPSGITRHLISGRALGLFYPLKVLRKKYNVRKQNRLLNDFINKKNQENRIRFYNEPTYFYND